ncbi:MAG: tRNA-dihydrouridine synthase 3 [Bogoriella megaspora]|nr:MAG: tRNA-dihydrouridine synthase 3 [Bogoriella megaspora]
MPSNQCNWENSTLENPSHPLIMAESDSSIDIKVDPANISADAINPVDASDTLKRPTPGENVPNNHPQQEILPGDSATARAEKIERHGLTNKNVNGASSDFPESAPKRAKVEHKDQTSHARDARDMRSGTAPIKAEYLRDTKEEDASKPIIDDDEAEESTNRVTANDDRNGQGKRQKAKGQNKNRTFGSSRDAIQLCASRKRRNEFSPEQCKFGEKCKFEHDLRKYLKEGKREDLNAFEGNCPAFAARGWCNSGWACRLVGSHSEERPAVDGKNEFVLLGNSPLEGEGNDNVALDEGIGVVNIVSMAHKIDLRKRKTQTPKADAFDKWLSTRSGAGGHKVSSDEANGKRDEESKDRIQENRAGFTEPPFRPSEKRKLYYGPDTPILAPLTTQGNLPFRRLCVELGAQVTWSEMAMGMPLLQGERQEWALMKAHETETLPPSISPSASVIKGYDNSKDLKFGAQIAGNKPWLALKTTEILTSLCPHLRAVDLNCGCPIDLVYRQGAGSALLDSPGKLERILRGMNAVSGEVPITVKIRTGTKDNKRTAYSLVERLALGGPEDQEFGTGPPGIAAVTLHGRSRQQRYTRLADWKYISDCAALINRLNKEQDERSDTIAEPDARNLANSNNGKLYFIGNGDCYSHIDYFDHIEHGKVDSVMLARGALIKPWLFEEIATGQYLDKSASERLSYVEKFARYGLEAWGSDEIGVGNTRRFLLEWLSFAHRYVPIGLLEVLPPKINERPPAYRGRDELETLMASENYKDWIKISEMFLGPAHKDFRFDPKHKSNSYEIEAEG